MKRIFVVLLLSFITGQLNAEKILQVGNKTIPFSVLKTIKEAKAYINPHYSQMSIDDFAKEMTDFYLIVNYAKQHNIHKKELAQYLMDKALYDFYIRDQVQSKYDTSKVKSLELRKFYKKYPTIKFSRLVIFFSPNNKKQKEKAYTKLSVLRGQLVRKRISFKQALKSFPSYTQNMNGIFDRMSMLDLPPQEVNILSKLKPGQYSPLIVENNFVALYGLIEKYHFGSVKDKKGLKLKYIKQKVFEALNKQIEELRQKNKDKIKIIQQ